MKLYPGGGPYEIYYAAPRNTEGLTDVKVSMWEHDGTKVLDNVSMSEVGDGIYKHEYNFDSSTWYVAQSYSESLNVLKTQSIRAGFPLNDYVYAVSNDSTNVYEVNKLDGTNVQSGTMIEIGSIGIFYTDVTSLPDDEYFFKLNHKDHARFSRPFKPRGGWGGVDFVLTRDFNIAAWSGSGKFNYDVGTDQWKYTSEEVDNTKASDLLGYIQYAYPDASIKYIKSYAEYPIERFRVYLPGITPEDDINNFPLIYENSEGDPEANAFYMQIETDLDEIKVEAL